MSASKASEKNTARVRAYCAYGVYKPQSLRQPIKKFLHKAVIKNHTNSKTIIYINK